MWPPCLRSNENIRRVSASISSAFLAIQKDLSTTVQSCFVSVWLSKVYMEPNKRQKDHPTKSKQDTSRTKGHVSMAAFYSTWNTGGWHSPHSVLPFPPAISLNKALQAESLKRQSRNDRDQSRNSGHARETPNCLMSVPRRPRLPGVSVSSDEEQNKPT